MEKPSGYVAQRENKICLKKAIYSLKQSPRAWTEKFSITISGIGFHHCHSGHSVFVRHTKSGLVILTVYFDILMTMSDSAGLVKIKEYLRHHFMTKDIGKPKNFLGIKIAYQKHSVLLSQREYDLDLMQETGLLGCKLAST